MFSRNAQEYIIACKMIIHRKPIAGLDIDHFTKISVEIFYNMVKDLKMQRCDLDFDRILLRIIVKENK